MVFAKDVFENMIKNFNKDAALEFKKKIAFQYEIKGDGGGTWHIILDNGNYELLEGPAERAVITYVFNSAESFHKVTTGEVDGIQAYTQGLVQVKGPVGIAQKFEPVFKP
jgi:putative sterol carrier protein